MTAGAADSAKRGRIQTKDGKRDDIVAAAADCFKRYGVQRSRVEDVANAAGISGTNFYHFFPSRSALIDAVVTAQVEAIVDIAAPTIHHAPSLHTALVDGVAATVDASRRDELFMELLRLTRQKRLGELGEEPKAFGYDMLERLWRPALERARQTGELRAELGDDQQTIVWLGRILVMLLLNDKLTPDTIRNTVTLYVAPAIAVS